MVPSEGLANWKRFPAIHYERAVARQHCVNLDVHYLLLFVLNKGIDDILCDGTLTGQCDVETKEPKLMRISSELNERLDEVFQAVGRRLGLVWQQFGASDFPEDNGVGFRNDMLEFSLGFFSELRHPDETDYWFETNMPLFEMLSTAQLVHVIGILHFYAVVRFPLESKLRISLDWIQNTYECSGEMATEWYDVAASIAQSGEFVVAQKKMYLAIAAATGADPCDDQNSSCWSGMAFILCHGRKRPKSYNAWCDEIFSG